MADAVPMTMPPTGSLPATALGGTSYRDRAAGLFAQPAIKTALPAIAGLGALAVMALGPVAQTWGAGAPLWVAAGCALVAAGLGLVLPQHRPG